MKAIIVARCALLAPFVNVLDEIGAPSARMLSKFGLPQHPALYPNGYFPLVPALQFVATAEAQQGISDFGFRAVQQLSFGHLSAHFQAAVRHAPTLFVALQHWCRFVQLEDTFARFWFELDEKHLRLCNVITGTSGLQHLQHSQWIQNVMTVHVVRQFAGPSWTPATMAFEARYVPSVEVQSLWPHTRFLSGQPTSWIDVPVSHLSLPNPASTASSAASAEEFRPMDTDMVSVLKAMLPSYLDEGVPSIGELAEIAVTSVRSLQRELARAGLSYSDLLDQVRFERGAELLQTTDAKIVEIALACGYTDAAHFARAFRRMAGATPRQFREQSS
jgi:AraC-like DNA-binding protein